MSPLFSVIVVVVVVIPGPALRSALPQNIPVAAWQALLASVQSLAVKKDTVDNHDTIAATTGPIIAL